MKVTQLRGDVTWWLAERRRGELSIEESVHRWCERHHANTGSRHKLPRRKSGAKVSIYMHEESFMEIREDARRHGRSISQTLQAAWAIAREGIEKYPSGTP
jgi:uncharacterized small protein (TIGR04563 family)